MIIQSDIKKFSAKNPAVSIGIFDGVHLGHRYMLDELKETAKKLEGESVFITFWPHPGIVLKKKNEDFRLLNSMDEKIALLESAGLDHLLIIPFTKSFSQLSADDFVKDILVDKVGVSSLLLGFNQSLGKDRQGDFARLQISAEKYGFRIEKLSAYALDSENISSSRIREYLLDGNVKGANRLLGREYSVSGKVIGGSRLGTSIGFPTANIIPDEDYKLLPADGVYAVRATQKGKSWKGMMNIGLRPTVNQDPEKKTLEVHLLEFEKNIYSEKIQVQFICRLREERRFINIDALKAQLQTDRESTMKIFRNSP